MICGECGRELEAGAKFCSICGRSGVDAANTERKYCSECGLERAPNHSFCPKCGSQYPDQQARKVPVQQSPISQGPNYGYPANLQKGNAIPFPTAQPASNPVYHPKTQLPVVIGAISAFLGLVGYCSPWLVNTSVSMNGRSFFEGTITFLISLAALTMALRNLKKVPTTTISLLFVAFGLAVFTIALYVYSVIVAYELEAGAGFYFSLISGVGLVLTGVWCFSTGKGIGKGRMQNM